MKAMRLLLAVGLVGGALASAPTSVAAAERLPTLRGRTIITGSEPAQMRVRLPAPVSTMGRHDWDFTITGDGRVVYFFLIKERRDGSLDGRAYLEGTATGHCGQEACADQTVGYSGGSWHGLGEEQVLPAGTYRLYLVADGAPVRIVLDLADLSGRTTLAPSEPVRAVIETIVPQLAMLSLPTWVGYSEAPFEGEGVAVLSSWFEDARAYGHCIYRQRPDSSPGSAT